MQETVTKNGTGKWLISLYKQTKNLLYAEETTAVNECGSSFAVFSCPAFVCSCGSAAKGIFYYLKGVKEYEF